MVLNKRSKEKLGKYIVLLILLVVVILSGLQVFPFLGAGGAELGGYGSKVNIGAVTGVGLTSNYYGTKVSFIIRRFPKGTNAGDENWYASGAMVNTGKMPWSTGINGAHLVGRSDPELGGAFPIFFIGGGSDDKAAEISNLKFGESTAGMEAYTVGSLDYNGSRIAFKGSAQAEMASKLVDLLSINWSSESSSGTNINSTLGLEYGEDLVKQRDDALSGANGETEETYLTGGAKNNIIFIGTLLNIAKGSYAGTYENLDDANTVFDHMIAKIDGRSTDDLPPLPEDEVEVVVLMEPMIGFNSDTSGLMGLTTIRAFEHMFMGGAAHNEPDSKAVKDKYISQGGFQTHWYAQQMSVSLGINSYGDAGEPNPIAARLHYTGRYAKGNATRATRGNNYWGFGTVYVPTLTDKISIQPALTVVAVHEYGTRSADGTFVPDPAQTTHEIIPILHNPDTLGWHDPSVQLDIPQGGSLTSRKDPLEPSFIAATRKKNLAGADEPATFSTTELVEWATTTNTHTIETGFHQKRGTTMPEVALGMGGEDLGNRETSVPYPDVKKWSTLLAKPEGSASWDSIKIKISGLQKGGATFTADPAPFEIPIQAQQFAKGTPVPDNAIISQVVYLHYQHVESDLQRIIIAREIPPSGGTPVETLLDGPVPIPADQPYVYTPDPPAELVEWFITKEKPPIPPPSTWDDTPKDNPDNPKPLTDVPVSFNPPDVFNPDPPDGTVYILIETPGTEWHEVHIQRIVNEETGVIVSEEVIRAREIPDSEIVGGRYTYNDPNIIAWYATPTLPRTDGPDWNAVRNFPPTLHAMVGNPPTSGLAPTGQGPAFLDTVNKPPPGGVLYVLLQETLPPELIPLSTDLEIKLTQHRITHTFDLMDIMMDSGEAKLRDEGRSASSQDILNEFWLPSRSWLLRPSLLPSLGVASNLYVFDIFKTSDVDIPDAEGRVNGHVSPPGPATENMISYVRQAQFRSKGWSDDTYTIQNMNRNQIDGYVIGSVEYAAPNNRWGVIMEEHEGSDTAVGRNWNLVMHSFGTEHYDAGAQGMGISRFHWRLGGMGSPPSNIDYSNQRRGAVKHPTFNEYLVPKFIFTVYRKNNLPMISHWAYTLDNRLKIADYAPEEDRSLFHILQEGINKNIEVGGFNKSAAATWWEPRASENLLDSRGNGGTPESTKDARITSRTISPRNTTGNHEYFTQPNQIKFVFTNDVDPLPDEFANDDPRYSTKSDDRIVFEWYVISEHWHVATWTMGPNGSGGHPSVPSGPVSIMVWNGTKSGSFSRTGPPMTTHYRYDSKGNVIGSYQVPTTYTSYCTIKYTFKTNWNLVVGNVVAGGGADDKAHEGIYRNSSPNQSSNVAYVEWENYTEASAWNTPARPVEFQEMRHAGGGRQRLQVSGMGVPSPAIPRPDRAADGGDDGRTLRYGTISEYAVLNTNLLTYSFLMRVQRYEGTAKTGNQPPTTPGTSKWVGSQFQAFNSDGLNPWANPVGEKRAWRSTPVTSSFKFYTYLEMLYDDVQDNQDLYKHKDEIFVLAEDQSTLHLYDSVELAWANRNPKRSIRFESNQWSGHARVSWLELRALNGAASENPSSVPVADLQTRMTGIAFSGMKERVLPGGALFKTLHQQNNFVTMGLRTWITFIQDDVRALLGSYMPDIGRSNMDLVGAVEHHRSLVGQYNENSGTGLINQSGSRYVSLYVNDKKRGPEPSGPDSSNERLEGLILNNASRYWRSAAVSTEDQRSSRVRPVDKVEDHTAYRMVSTVDGKVYLERKNLGSNPGAGAGNGFDLGSNGWYTVQQWSQTDNATLGTGSKATGLNAEAKELDDNTGLISGFFQALNRNQGDDPTSEMDYAPHWYNEAFRGFGVIVSESMWRYNLWDATAGGPATGNNSPTSITNPQYVPQGLGGFKMQALDPRLAPLNKYGQAGMFTRIFYADARINAFRYRIGGQSEGGWRSVTVPAFGRDGRAKVSLELNDNYGREEYGEMIQGNDAAKDHRFFIPNATVQDLR